MTNSDHNNAVTGTPVHGPIRINKFSKAKRPIQLLSILIPCYNESKTIIDILDRIISVRLIGGTRKEIVIVNDRSTDDTDSKIKEFIEQYPSVAITYIVHEINQGKGAAIKTALNASTGDYIIIQDADLEYTPNDYNKLLRPILSNDADVVYGSRFKGGEPHRILFFWHTIGNKMLTFISNLFTNLNLTDAHTCYKLLPKSMIIGLDLQEKRFAFDAELNVKLARLQNIRIYEVGICYYGRTFADGKKIRFRDALRTVYCLFKYRILKPAPQKARKSEKIPTQIMTNI